MSNFERRVLRKERTTTIVNVQTVVHGIVETPSSCSVVSISSAALCYAKQITIFYCQRSEILVCRVHEFVLECIKKCAL